MKGYPILWTLDDMATLVFCFLAVGCQILISSWILILIMRVHSSLRLSIFEFSGLKEAVTVCPKLPMRFIQVDVHRETQISAQCCSIQLCHRLVGPLVTFADSFTSLHPA